MAMAPCILSFSNSQCFGLKSHFLLHSKLCYYNYAFLSKRFNVTSLFKKILIANRGEVAVRIARACAELGIKSVAIYTDADRHALHVKKADEAYHVGSDPLMGYLNAHNIVNLAVAVGCDALHPGYGFLSENPLLAEICARRGIRFIGPSARLIRTMGNKVEAREAMIQAGIPVVPGSEGSLSDIEEAKALAQKIGYPVMLKATTGGGGRGIRRCDNVQDLERFFDRALSEAEKAFGKADIYLEKCVENPRHIEVQVLADSFGNVVHLFERDCSIQRRNQKLIEIAPSPQLDAKKGKKSPNMLWPLLQQSSMKMPAPWSFCWMKMASSISWK